MISKFWHETGAAEKIIILLGLCEAGMIAYFAVTGP